MSLKSAIYFFVLFYSEIQLISSQRDLPSYFPRCYRDDPDLNQCMLKATDQVRPFLKKGVPELNIPSLSPFFIPEINLQQGTDAVSYQSSFKNVVITGLDNYKFSKVEFDVKILQFVSALDMGLLNIKGNYSIKGKILTVPVEGKGEISLDILSSNGSLIEETKLVTRKGIDYLEATKTNIQIDVGEVKSKFTGLFDGNEVLVNATRAVLKENIREIIKEVKPAIVEVLSRIVEDVVFKSLSKVPFDKLYPVHKKAP